MAEDEISKILKKQVDANMGSYFEAQERGVIAFAEYLARRVQDEAPVDTGLLKEQVDWRFSSVAGKPKSQASKTVGISGKNLYFKLRDAKGRFAAQETMSVEVGVINPTGWNFSFPVPYAAAQDMGATVRTGSDTGHPVPRIRRGGRLAIPAATPLGMASGIFGRKMQRGVNVYARDVINNPRAFGLRSVFKSKAGNALMGQPIQRDAPDAEINWLDRVIFRMTDEFKIDGNEYLTATLERDRQTAVGKFAAEIARWKAAP
jgi:hypothetical protein